MENNQMSQEKNKGKLLWWIIGIAVVLAIGYGAVKFMGSDSDSTTDTGSEELSASELSDIPATGEELVEDSVISEEDDVNLGEDLI